MSTTELNRFVGAPPVAIRVPHKAPSSVGGDAQRLNRNTLFAPLSVVLTAGTPTKTAPQWAQWVQDAISSGTIYGGYSDAELSALATKLAAYAAATPAFAASANCMLVVVAGCPIVNPSVQLDVVTVGEVTRCGSAGALNAVRVKKGDAVPGGAQAWVDDVSGLLVARLVAPRALADFVSGSEVELVLRSV